MAILAILLSDFPLAKESNPLIVDPSNTYPTLKSDLKEERERQREKKDK